MPAPSRHALRPASLRLCPPPRPAPAAHRRASAGSCGAHGLGRGGRSWCCGSAGSARLQLARHRRGLRRAHSMGLPHRSAARLLRNVVTCGRGGSGVAEAGEQRRPRAGGRCCHPACCRPAAASSRPGAHLLTRSLRWKMPGSSRSSFSRSVRGGVVVHVSGRWAGTRCTGGSSRSSSARSAPRQATQFGKQCALGRGAGRAGAGAAAAAAAAATTARAPAFGTWPKRSTLPLCTSTWISSCAGGLRSKIRLENELRHKRPALHPPGRRGQPALENACRRRQAGRALAAGPSAPGARLPDSWDVSSDLPRGSRVACERRGARKWPTATGAHSSAGAGAQQAVGRQPSPTHAAPCQPYNVLAGAL